MKKLLTLALLAQIGVAHAHECQIESVYPTSLGSLSGLGSAGFEWVGLQPPIGFNGGIAGEGTNECKAQIGPGNGPSYPVALVHAARPTDRTWVVRALDIKPSDNAEDNALPYWSLQLSDAGNTSLGVLTATLLPRRQKLAVSLTVQTPASEVPVVTTAYFTYSAAPLCAELRFNLGTPNALTRTLTAAAGCQGAGWNASQSTFNLPATLVPRTVRIGKLSADPDPSGTFIFQIVRDTNP